MLHGFASWPSVLVLGLALLAGCSHPADTKGSNPYTPRTREVTITTVPVLVREQERVFPFLHDAFAKGGVLEGHELYAFVPSSITAVEGDTLRLTVINPEDDAHTLVLPGLALALPGLKTTRTTYVAPRAGIYSFVCNMPAHSPMMWGQLVVLSPSAFGRTMAGGSSGP
jgi:plastocyanin